MRLTGRSQRLRTTIIAWSFVPAALILGLVAFAHFVSFQYLTQDLVADHNRDLVTLLANQYAGEVDELAQPLWTLASDLDVISGDPARQQAALVTARDRLWDFDAGVVVLSPQGRITAADERRLSLIGRDWAARPFLDRVRQEGAAVLSDLWTDQPGGQPVIALAVPVTDDSNQLTGMVAGLFAVGMPEARVTTFYRDLKKVMLDAGETTYVVDGSGQVIFHRESWRIGEMRAEQTEVRRVLRGETGTQRSTTRDGQPIIASYTPVPHSTWGVVVEEDWEKLTAASLPYQRLLLALLGLGLVIPALAVALGARRITRPVHEFISGAQAVAAGDFSRRITPRGSHEIRELAAQFNRMAAQLQTSYATLEQRVADRTRDLATLNAIAAVASRSLDITEVLDATLDKILEVTGMSSGAAYRFDAQQQVLKLVVQRGLPAAFTDHAANLPRAESAAGFVHDDLRPAVVRVEGYADGTLKRILTAAGVQMAISIPLTAKGRILGFINLGSQAWRDVAPDACDLMAAIGQQVGVAVENAQLYEQAEAAAAAAERSRLARELHDAVSQTLFSASMIAGVLPRLWERDPQAAREQLAQLHQLTKGAQAEMRILLLELRPDAMLETPLGDLLQQLGQATSSRAMVPVEVALSGDCQPPVEIKVALYRIAQEALNNVIKHADADRVRISLACDEQPDAVNAVAGAPPVITLIVQDDGAGFDPARIPRERLGQRTMRERADAIGAALTVISAIGQGTTVTCRWPALPGATR